MLFTSKDIFCDFLSVSQIHKTLHTPCHSAISEYTDTETGVLTRSYKFKSIQGIHFSNVQLRSDGQKTEFSGNISRWNRSEGFHGLTLDECKKAINHLMLENDLPPFTDGKIKQLQDKTSKNETSVLYTGAIISRLDMTINIATGSPDNRDAYLKYIQSIQHPTLDKLLWNLNTYFGKYSDSRTIRIYDKAKQLIETSLSKSDESDYLQLLIDDLNQQGVIRLETEYHRYLRHESMRFWHVATHKKLCKHFMKDVKLMTRKIKALDFDEIPMASLGVLMSYMAGINVKKKMSKNTFSKHKNILIQYGYDISNQNVQAIQPKQKTIVLTVAEVPDFYKHPDKPWLLKSV